MLKIVIIKTYYKIDLIRSKNISGCDCKFCIIKSKFKNLKQKFIFCFHAILCNVNQEQKCKTYDFCLQTQLKKQSQIPSPLFTHILASTNKYKHKNPHLLNIHLHQL